jgi:xylulokinase
MPAVGATTPRRVVLGFDVGTTSSKAVAVDLAGELVASARVEHGVSTPHPGWVEHDADAVWWGDVVTLSRRLIGELGRATDIAAVGVTTCGPCLVPVDRAGRPLRAGILYGVDTRAREQVAAMTARIGRRAILRLSGMPLSSQSVGPKLAWIAEHEPEVARRAAMWHTATSFIVSRLTGEWAIDHHQASFFGPFVDAGRRAWDLRHAAGLDLADRLPPLRWPGDVAGTVTTSAATATGLPAGAPVVVGTSDGPSEALAVGASRPGIVALTLGSTATVTTVGPRPPRARGLWVTEGWAPDRTMIGAGLATSGAVVDWVRRELGRDLPADDVEARAILDREASAVPAAAGDPLALPYFGGERTPFDDPLARGVIAGLGIGHTRGQIHRAILEGIAFGIRHLLETLERGGVPIAEIRVAGGGTASLLGLEIVADVTGRELVIPDSGVGAATGAALLAAMAITYGPAADDPRPAAAGGPGRGSALPAGSWSRPTRRIAPDPVRGAIHARRYPLFRRLYRDTRHVVHALAGAER